MARVLALSRWICTVRLLIRSRTLGFAAPGSPEATSSFGGSLVDICPESASTFGIVPRTCYQVRGWDPKPKKTKTENPKKIMKFYYTYVIQSKKDGNFYTGFTSDLRKRLQEHNRGKNISTKWRIPFELIYFESCLRIEDAKQREKYLKSGIGKKYIKMRPKSYLTG
ncbi:MAG: GIY-YIG nuclease family protein [Thermodesulfobacteriota bacterium]|nr:GIY-YIG nuclease family protein [Thermodesulfobacteriota bacterium]